MIYFLPLRKVLYAFTFLLIIPIYSQAQTAMIVDANAKIDPTGSGSNQRASFIIELSDTNNLSQIELKLGSIEGESNIISQVLDYDVTTGLPSGFSYSRLAYKVTIVTNSFTDQNTYFGEVRVKDNSGSWSDAFKFITN